MEDERNLILRAGLIAELVVNQIAARGEIQSLTDRVIRAELSEQYSDETIDQVMEFLAKMVDLNKGILINQKKQ